MCGRYTLGIAEPGEFDDRFGGKTAIDILGRYNVAPTEPVPIVAGGRGGQGAFADRVAREAHWGLLPSWATSRKERLKPINARVESLTEKRMFAPLLATAEHRVLVLADGWYEWLRGEDPKQARIPFHHVVDGGGPIAFAGLARTVRLREGDDSTPTPLLTVTVVTVPANAVAARLHDRMPAVLAGPEEEAAWLSSAVAGPEALGLCRPLDDARLSLRPASPLVNSVRSADGPWLLDPSVERAPDAADAPQTSLDLSGADGG